MATKKEYFMDILAIVQPGDDIELTNFVKDQLIQLNKKAKKSEKDIAQALQLQRSVLDVMSNCELMTCTDITNKLDNVYSSQKISSVLSSLIRQGKIKRTSEKRVSYFSIATEDEEQKENE